MGERNNMSIDKAIELLKKSGEVPKDDYYSINSNLLKGNNGAPCGACGACGIFGDCEK